MCNFELCKQCNSVPDTSAACLAAQMDLQLESGEYFLSAEQKAARAAAAAQARQQARTEERQRQREAAFVAPEAAGKSKQVRSSSLLAHPVLLVCVCVLMVVLQGIVCRL